MHTPFFNPKGPYKHSLRALQETPLSLSLQIELNDLALIQANCQFLLDEESAFEV